MPTIDLFVNGQSHTVEIVGDMPLLWVLRDVLDLRGTKFGCGRGLCGACTVHVDGAAMRSCVTSVVSVAHQKITTIEGLGGAELHALQTAWIDEDVPQCGYCQAGQIMMAASLLSVDPDPDDDAIKRAMSNNLCRCGSYLRIRAAVRRSATVRRAQSRDDGELTCG